MKQTSQQSMRLSEEDKTSRKKAFYAKRVRVFCDLFIRKNFPSPKAIVVALFFLVVAVITLKTLIIYYIHALITEKVDTYYESMGVLDRHSR